MLAGDVGIVDGEPIRLVRVTAELTIASGVDDAVAAEGEALARLHAAALDGGMELRVTAAATYTAGWYPSAGAVGARRLTRVGLDRLKI